MKKIKTFQAAMPEMLDSHVNKFSAFIYDYGGEVLNIGVKVLITGKGNPLYIATVVFKEKPTDPNA